MRDDGLEGLRAAVEAAGSRVASVSNWSVGMHIHHCSLATIGICQSLIVSRPPLPRSHFSIITSFVFWSGRIPRGRGQAPQSALPKQDVSQAELLSVLDEAERILTEAKKQERDAWYKHFVFGVLDRDKTIRFIHIHNDHHLRIMSDIVTAQRSAGRSG